MFIVVFLLSLSLASQATYKVGNSANFHSLIHSFARFTHTNEYDFLMCIIFRSLQNCRLGHLIKITEGKRSIRKLNLASNRLKRIEEFEFVGWSNLEELDLSSNEIVIKQSGNGNFFRDVPKSIKKL